MIGESRSPSVPEPVPQQCRASGVPASANTIPAMPRSADVAVVACIEPGVLERQALLLFESVRAFGGALANCPIYAVAPRAGLGVGRQTRARLAALGVDYVEQVLNTECVEYGSANRVVAAAHIEASTAHEVLVVLDSDTLVLREPRGFLLPPDVDVAARPVDVKGIGTCGPQDRYDAYWRELCRLCDVDYGRIPWLPSTVDEVSCKANYNGGLVVVRSGRGILRRWSDFFLASVRAGLRPRAEAVAIRSSTGAVGAAASRLWGSNQAALSLAIWSTTERVRTLDASYDYPLHLHQALGERRTRDFDELVHVHYHWLFEPDAFGDNPLTASTSTLSADKLAWLRERTPFGAAHGARGHSAPAPRSAGAATAATAATTEVADRACEPAATTLSGSRRALIVLGMHRSGTSALTRTLSLLGARLPRRLIEAGPGNPKGHWESAELGAINDRALESAGTSWRGITPLPESWYASPAAAAFRDEILAVLRRDFAEARLFVIKDPRICRLLPLWRSALERFGVEPAFLIAFRNPLEVAGSLAARNGLTQGHSLLMWLRHVIDAERGCRGARRVVVSYEALLGDWRGLVGRVGQALGLEWPSPGARAQAGATDFLERGMRHQRATVEDVRRRPEVPPWVRTLYEALIAAEAGDPAALGRVVDAVGLQLDQADQVFAPLIADREQRAAEQAERLGLLERDLAAWRERSARLQAALDATHESSSWRLTEPLRTVFVAFPRAARVVRSALRFAR